MIFLLGIIMSIIGIIDLRFDFDKFTYVWLITGVFYSIVGFFKKKHKENN